VPVVLLFSLGYQPGARLLVGFARPRRRRVTLLPRPPKTQGRALPLAAFLAVGGGGRDESGMLR
jgi:hypothetical protein